MGIGKHMYSGAKTHDLLAVGAPRIDRRAEGVVTPRRVKEALKRAIVSRGIRVARKGACSVECVASVDVRGTYLVDTVVVIVEVTVEERDQRGVNTLCWMDADTALVPKEKAASVAEGMVCVLAAGIIGPRTEAA